MITRWDQATVFQSKTGAQQMLFLFTYLHSQSDLLKINATHLYLELTRIFKFA